MRFRLKSSFFYKCVHVDLFSIRKKDECERRSEDDSSGEKLQANNYS